MKVLQTLGRHQANGQEGIFQYRRTPDGVVIDSSVGQANLNPATFTLTSNEWQAILTAIRAAGTTYRLTRTNTPDPPRLSLYDMISNAVPNPAGGWVWTDSHRSYVAAILEHEGSIDHYAGTLGGGHTTPIILAHDVA